MRSKLIPIGLALLAACGSSDGGSAAGGPRSTTPLVPVARDTAGGVILEHEAGALERAPRIALDSTAIGEVMADSAQDDLSRVFLGVALSDGGFAFFDPVRSAVWVVDSTGAVRRVLGRRGKGPGEFGWISGGVARGEGDTLAVTDAQNARVTLLHPAGGIVREAPFIPQVRGDGFSLNGRLPDGSWVASPASWILVGTGAPSIGERRGVPIQVVDPFADPARRDSVGYLTSVPAVKSRYRMMGREEDGVSFAQFADPGRAFAWGGAPAFYDNRSWQVVRLDAGGGGRQTVIRVVAGERTPTPAMVESLVVRRRSDAMRPLPSGQTRMETADEAEFTTRNRPLAEVISPFSMAHVGPQGTLWLVDQPVPGEPTVAVTAMDTAGRLLGRTAVPAAWRILAVGEDRILLRILDEDGVAALRIHRLRRD